MKVDKELLERQIRAQWDNYAERRQHNKRVSRTVATLCAGISGITTVLIGFSSSMFGPSAKYVAWFAMVTSASVGFIAAWDALFNHKKLWVLYTQHWVAMDELLLDLEHVKSAEPDNDHAYELLYGRFRDIRKSLDSRWTAMKLEDFGNAQTQN